MRLTAIAGLFLCLAIFASNSPEAHAEIDNKRLALGEIKVADALDGQIEIKDLVSTDQPKQPSPKEYVVKKGDRLTIIAGQHSTTWQRIFAKNANIADPNLLNIGDKLIIPEANENLPERSVLPEVTKSSTPNSKNISNSKGNNNKSTATNTVSKRGSSAGNTYSGGYCTYYAKQRRPDLPNNLGNASTWVSRARAQGIPTGTVPRVGAIGQKGNHVVYVERLNNDGTITISDMNWAGLWKITTRTVPANSHTYIY